MTISNILIYTTPSDIVHNILGQTFTDFELLVYNPSNFILPNDTRIVNISEPDIENDHDIYNYLVFRCKNDIVCKFDERFTYPTNKLQIQLDAFIKHSCVMLGTGYERRFKADYVCEFNDIIVLDSIAKSNEIKEGTEMFNKRMFTFLDGYTDVHNFEWEFNKRLFKKKLVLNNVYKILAKER